MIAPSRRKQPLSSLCIKTPRAHPCLDLQPCWTDDLKHTIKFIVRGILNGWFRAPGYVKRSFDQLPSSSSQSQSFIVCKEQQAVYYTVRQSGESKQVIATKRDAWVLIHLLHHQTEKSQSTTAMHVYYSPCVGQVMPTLKRNNSFTFFLRVPILLHFLKKQKHRT